jgi:hypothetical protein
MAMPKLTRELLNKEILKVFEEHKANPQRFDPTGIDPKTVRPLSELLEKLEQQ